MTTGHKSGPNSTQDQREEISKKILSLMSQGFSLAASAAECDIHRQRIYDWAEKDQELSDTINLGRSKRQYFLEKRLLTEESGPKITSTIFALKNAAPEDWREKTDVAVSGNMVLNVISSIPAPPNES